MNDDELSRLLEQARDTYHRPPEPPREAMWAAIAARRRPSGMLRWRPRLDRRVAWPVGIAALLALGFALGRWSGGPAGPGPVSGAGTPLATAPKSGISPALAGATLQHLSSTETFLTGFRLQADHEVPDAQLLGHARDLLSTTRLLLDSPDQRDPRLRALLQELEMVLAQITQLQAYPSREDAGLIVRQLDRHGVLPRLRTAIPAGPTLTLQGES